MSIATQSAVRAQTLALAAMVECGICVDELARSGRSQHEPVQALLTSLLRFEWQQVEDIYGGAHTLQRGLQRLEALPHLMPGREHAPELRYTLALAHLGKLLGRDQQRLGTIRTGLRQIAGDAEQFTDGFAGLAPALAAIYEDTVSRYRFRIKVLGNAEQLRDPQVVARIRALLLAGVRAAVLWRHLGGSLSGLLFNRTRIAAESRALRSGS